MEGKFVRNCPSCGKEIYHATEAYCKYRDKQKILCKSCACRNPDRLKKMSEMNSGIRNPFYGKRHTDASRKKLVDNHGGGRPWTDDDKEKMSKAMSGGMNPMFGRSLYSVWTAKYGKEEADKKLACLKSNHSVASSGERNPMYGKPAPQGSGNGWSGWYKGWYLEVSRS